METKHAKEDVFYTFPNAFPLSFVILATTTQRRKKKKEREREREGRKKERKKSSVK